MLHDLVFFVDSYNSNRLIAIINAFTMRFSPLIKDLLSEQCRCPLQNPADCQTLAFDIESRTGEHLGVNTVKRLLGFIDDERQPRVATLDIIARYLGYDSWEALSLVDNENGNSGFGSCATEIHASDLKPGDCVLVTYQPGRSLVLEFQGGNSFTVIESENSKLLVADELSIDHVVQGYPLLVSSVVRAGQNWGSFTAGKVQGVEFKIL